MRRRVEQDQIAELLRSASPAALEAALRALRNDNGGNGHGKRKRKCRFKGTDHWLTKQELEQLCAASEEPYRTMWKLAAAHGLRVSELCALRPADVENGFLTVSRLKGSQRTVQKLLVDLSHLTNKGSVIHCRRSAGSLL